MLYVLRHGEVETNIKGLLNGWNEEPLTEVGIRQARQAGIQLRLVKFAAIYCSPLLRARQTYANLARTSQSEPVFYDNRLKERFSGTMTLRPAAEADPALWFDPTKTLIYENTEGLASIIQRVRSLLAELLPKYHQKDVLLVTHEDVCKAIRLCFYPETPNISEISQGNCEIVTYRW